MRRAIVALVLGLAAAHAQAQPATGSGSATILQLPPDASAPQVTAAASPSDVKLGARFTLFVTAVYDPGVEVNLREPVDLGAAFEVKRRVSEDHPRADGKHVREWQIEVYAWELGDLQVPPVAVTFTVAGRAGQVATNAVPVRVSGVLGGADDPKLMRDSAPPVALASRDWFWVWVAAFTVAALVVGLVMLWGLRQRRRRVRALVGGLVVTIEPRRIDMTGERALEQLLAIDRSGVLARDGERKPGYAAMVDVIRDYLGARYRFATRDLTTSELLRGLAQAAPAGEREVVESWLERCDLVKYGGFRATADDAQAVLVAARELVVATTGPLGAKEAA